MTQTFDIWWQWWWWWWWRWWCAIYFFKKKVLQSHIYNRLFTPLKVGHLLLQDWNDGMNWIIQQYNSIIRRTMQYIVLASNSALKWDANYLFSAMDVDLDVKCVGASDTAVYKQISLIRSMFSRCLGFLFVLIRLTY